MGPPAQSLSQDPMPRFRMARRRPLLRSGLATRKLGSPGRMVKTPISINMSPRRHICEFRREGLHGLNIISISGFLLNQLVHLEAILPPTGIRSSLELCSHVVGTCISLVIPTTQNLPWDQRTYGHERVESFRTLQTPVLGKEAHLTSCGVSPSTKLE